MTRCDGCGRQSNDYVLHNRETEVRYCPSCEFIREKNEIEPADHEQYRLRATANEQESEQ